MIELFTLKNLLAFLTLSSLEIVLGIDNIVFIAILTSKLPQHLQSKARKIGLGIAMVARIVLLFCISWIMGLTEPWFSILDFAFTGREVILLAGGMFLIAKATLEIHHKVENSAGEKKSDKKVASFGAALVQIALIDIVFSLDSVITAVGMADEIAVMVAAIVVAVGVMFVFADPVSEFIEHHPTLKILGLSFLLLIGVMLVAEGFGKHVDKGYIYFAMGFSLGVELLNLKISRRKKSVT